MKARDFARPDVCSVGLVHQVIIGNIHSADLVELFEVGSIASFCVLGIQAGVASLSKSRFGFVSKLGLCGQLKKLSCVLVGGLQCFWRELVVGDSEEANVSQAITYALYEAITTLTAR